MYLYIDKTQTFERRRFEFSFKSSKNRLRIQRRRTKKIISDVHVSFIKDILVSRIIICDKLKKKVCMKKKDMYVSNLLAIEFTLKLVKKTS
jgi:hypothetical protein